MLGMLKMLKDKKGLALVVGLVLVVLAVVTFGIVKFRSGSSPVEG